MLAKDRVVAMNKEEQLNSKDALKIESKEPDHR